MRHAWARVTEGGKWHEGVLLRCHRIRTRCGRQEKIEGEPVDEPPGARCETCRQSLDTGWRCTLCSRDRRDDQDCPHPRMRALGHTAKDATACGSRGCMARARVAVLDELGGRAKVFCDGHRAAATRLHRELLREQLKLMEGK